MIKFSSSAAGDFSLFDAPARELLRMAGRLDAARGAIGADEVPAALQALQAALSHLPAAPPATAATDDANDDEAPEPAISLRQRAYPLIEMLERAAARRVPVLWDAA